MPDQELVELLDLKRFQAVDVGRCDARTTGWHLPGAGLSPAQLCVLAGTSPADGGLSVRIYCLLCIRKRVRLPIAILLMAVWTIFVLAAPPAAAAPPEQQPLRIAVKPIAPFVMVDDAGELSGFSIDLWEAIADTLDYQYQWVQVKTVGEQLAAVTQQQADAAIAAISITAAREEQMDFSFSYFQSGLGILTPARSPLSGFNAVALAFSPALLRLLAAIFVLLLIVGHLVWFFERKRNPHFPQDYLHGIWAGIWWAGVTVTTVGYGDKTPTSAAGRLVGLIWMFAGLIVVANFTAAVTAQLAVNELRGTISGPRDLPGKRITTVAGSTADEWLTGRGLPHIATTTIDEAYGRLNRGATELIVYDYPVLLYYTLDEGGGSSKLAGGPFSVEEYGIAFSAHSPLREQVNRALLQLREEGVYDQIYTRWFGVRPGALGRQPAAALFQPNYNVPGRPPLAPETLFPPL